MQFFVFVCAALMILGGAVGVIASKHPVHSALSLVLTLFGVAVMYVAQDAHFLAAVQVIVYAGAIVVLFLFVIMLLGVDKVEDIRIEPIPIQRPLAAIVSIGIVGTLIAAVTQARSAVGVAASFVTSSAAASGAKVGIDIPTETGQTDSNIRQLARDLFSNHVFAFELTSILLVVAVVGTVLLARRPDKLGSVQ